MGCRRRRSSFLSLTFVTVSRGLCVMTETTWVSFGTLTMCLPLQTLSHLPLNVGFLSFLTLGDCSSLSTTSFRTWSFDFSSSDQYEVLQTILILTNSVVHCFWQFLGRTKSRQSEAEQILTCTILPGSYLKAFHSLIKVHDPMWRRNLWTSSFCKTYSEQLWESLYCFIGSGCTEILVDHASNLSPS